MQVTPRLKYIPYSRPSMQRNIYVLFLLFLYSLSSRAQCALVSAVSDVTLQSATASIYRSGVAFNSSANLYYSGEPGTSFSLLETFSVTGGSPLYTTTSGVDLRGLWFNTSTGKPETNSFSGPIFSYSLNASNYCTNITTTISPYAAPYSQCSGACDIANNVVYYYYNGNISKYNRSSGASISTTSISGLPVASSNLNAYNIGFTGISGKELIVYDYVLKKVYFINAANTTVSYTCTLPSTAPAPSSFNFSFANNRIFLFDSSTNRWIGYQIVSTSNCPGEAINLDGTNDYVSIAHSSSLNAFPLTVETWVKTSHTGTTTLAGIVGKYVSNSLNGWLLYNYGGYPYGLYFVNGSNAVGFPITSSVSIADNNWHHVAMVIDASGGRIYVDGIQAGPLTPWSGTPGAPSSSQAVFIGAYDAYLPGTMDEVRIWNTARSQCDIQTYMKAEIPSTATGLMANYHFNQGLLGVSNSTVTTVTDAAGANTGTLIGLALTGTASNWVAPGGVISGYTVASVPGASLVVKGNGNNVPVGATTSTANNTDFGGAFSKTFQLANSGTGTLNINGAMLSGASASLFTISPQPSSTLASSATSTFNILYTPTVIGTNTVLMTINSNDCTYPNYTFVISASSGTGSALAFDGTNDQVAVGTNTVLDVLNAPFTMEAWVYPTTTKYNTIISKGDGNGQANNGEYIFQVSNNGKLALHNTAVNGWKYSNGTIPNNQWTHVAAVYNGTNTYFYINGLLDSFQASATNTANSTGYSFYIGRQGQTCNCNFFQGALDEVRVWKEARTQCQIQTFMSCEIPTTATNLVANYHFNNGIPSGNNGAYTTLSDVAGTNTGTLTGFTLSGSTSNWVANTPVTNGYTTTTTQAASLAITGNGNNVPVGATTSTANNTNFNGALTNSFVLSNAGTGTVYITTGYFTGPNAAQFSVTTIPSTAIATGTTAMAITLTPTAPGVYNATLNIISNDCTAPNYSFAVTSTIASATALQFDGSNDLVTRGVLTTTQTNVSLQAKVRWNNTAANQMIAYNGSSGSNGCGLYLTSNGAVSLLFGGITYYPFNYTLTAGVWTSLTAVVKPGIGEFYVNGIMTNTVVITTMGVPSGSFNIGANGIGFEYFSGYIDEVLFWNKPLSHCEIQSYLTSEITSTMTGLLANYHFNQGLPSGTNTGLTTLLDATGSYNATLNGFALSGSTSNWTSPSPAAVVSGNTLTTPPGSSLTITGNGNNVPVGATTGTNNFTNFGNSLSRTFVISNSGTGTLNINYLTLSGANAAQFSFATLPSSAVTTGTTNLQITLTPTAVGNYSAVVNLQTNDCANPNYSFVVTCSIAPVASVCLTGVSGWGVGNNVTGVALADMNNDNSLDAISIAESNNRVIVMLGTPNGSFTTVAFYSVGVTPENVAIADFNGDSNLDVVASNKGSNNVSILLGSATGTLGTQTTFASGNQPYGVVTDDFNSDGKPDVATANNGSGDVSVFLGNGSGGLGTATSYTTGSGAIALVSHDFNADGKLDLAVANYSANNVAILFGTGGGSFGSAQAYTVGNGPTAIAKGDIDNDGIMDLVVVNYVSNTMSYLKGVGSGSFVVSQTYTTGSGPRAIGVADMNGDGKLDIVVCHVNTINTTVYYGAGFGIMTAVTYPVAGNVRAMALGYVNNDNLPDLATANYSNNAVSFILNGPGLMTTITPSVLCSGYTATLAAMNCTNYNWNPGNINSGTITVTPTSTSVYTVTGTNSSGCTGTAVRTLVVVPANSLTVTGFNNVIAAGSTTTSTLNATDWDGAITQTYVINNSTGSISISGVTDSGPNAAQYFITTQPSTSLGIGSTSFVVVLTPTATGVYNSTINVSSNNCAYPTYSFVTTSSISTAAALSFDGANDNVSVATNSLINFGTGDMTIEADIKTSQSNSNFTGIVVKASTSAIYGFQLGIQNGKIAAEIGSSSTFLAATNGLAGVTNLANNTWHHLAMVVNRSQNSVKLYVDGILDAVVTHTAIAGMDISTTFNLFIGRERTGNYFFNGFIDEVRLWNVARSQCEIQTYMSAEITSTASGLVANYHFNQGVPGANNTSITTLTEAANGLTGTLSNIARTGITSNFIYPGAVPNGYTTTAAPTASIVLTGNGASIPQSAATSTANNTDFGSNTSRTFSITNTGTGTLNINNILVTGTGSSQFSVNTLPSSAITTGTTGFQITYVPTVAGQATAVVMVTSNDCASPNYSFVITASTSPASALSFDGSNDHVLLPNNLSTWNIGNNFTIETWIKPNTVSSTQLLLYTGYGCIDCPSWALSIGPESTCGFSGGSTGRVVFMATNKTSTNAVVQSLASPSVGVWSHVAVTGDGSTLRMYLNGVLQSTAPLTFTIPSSTYRNIGADPSTTGGCALRYAYNGNMDELRFWNVARSQCEIQTYMNAEITTTATGLTANYHFNQGVPAGANATQTLLVDAAATNNGTLTNVALTGTTSNWVSPGGVVNGFTTAAAPGATLSVSGNGNNVPIGATTSTTNNTDFGTNTTRSYSISNTGTTTLYINTITFTGANAAQFSVNALPATSLAVGSTSTLSILFTPTAVGISSAVVNISSNDCVNSNYSFVITASAAPAGAITFDGVNDYVAVTTSTAIPSGNSPYTIEAWIKTTTSANMGIVAWGNYGTYSECNAFRLGAGGTIVNYWWANDLIASAPTLTNGAWHHVAATFDGVTRSIYADGILLASDTPTGLSVSTTTNITIGTSNNLNEFFNGSIDEVRVWNVARTQCQLQQYMKCEITSTASGLVFNSHFNQGLPSGSNTAVFTLSNSAGPNNGTLNNFALNGSSSNWTSPGGVVSGSVTPATLASSLSITGNGNNVPIGATTTTANLTQFGSATSNSFVISNTGTGTLNIGSVTFSGMSGALFSVTTLPATSITTNTTAFAIAFTPTAAGICSAVVKVASNDCTNPTYSFVITGSVAPASALRLDGTNDVVNCGTDPSLDIAVGTWEAWVNLSTLSTNSRIFFKENADGAGSGMYESYYLASSGKFQADLKIASTPYFVVGATSPTTNTWYHVAATYDGQYFRLYVNGVLDGVTAVNGGTMNPGTGHLGLGATVSNPNTSALTGSIDEARLWNYPRTQCEIQQFMNCEITSTASGLVANYHFNQGLPAGNNSLVTSVVDATGINTGTLVNFALTGTTSNWVNPGGVTTGSVIPATISTTISVSGNGNIVPTGVTTSTVNGTNLINALTGSFVIAKTGTTVLNIGPVYFTGANAAQFSVTTSPTTALSSGTTALGITISPTATGVQSATVNIGSNDCANPNYSFVITTSVLPAAALNFNGTGAYVVTNNTVSGSYTKEAWIYATNSGLSNNIMSSGTNNVGTVFWAPSANGFRLASGHDGIWTQVQDASALTTNTWYHVAVTFDGSTNTMKLYKNGVMVAMNNSVAPSVSVTPVLIGSYDNGNFFQGKIDEVRVWNYARTQCDLQTYMNCEITSTMTGLTANYHFNQGVPGGSNATTTLAVDATGSGSGTLTGFALTGTLSNWVNPGGVTSGSTAPATVNATLSVTGNGNNVPVGNTTSTVNGTSMGTLTAQTFSVLNSGTGTLNIGGIYFTGPNANQFSVTTLPVSLINGVGGSSFAIAFTPTTTGVSTATVNITSNDCTNPTYSFAIQGTAPTADALYFDGFNDYAARSAPVTTATNNITLQAKVKLTGGTGYHQFIASNGSYALMMNVGGNFCAYVLPFGIITTTYAVPTNTWVALSMVLNNSNVSLYANGNFVGSAQLNAVTAPTGSFVIGANVFGGEMFKGVIDEVLVWNRSLSHCEIQSYLSTEIATTATSLIANYHFNQGSPNLSNSSATTLLDAAGNNYTLALTNFALTGTVSNWVSPGGVAKGNTVTTQPTATLLVSANGNSINQGATTTSTANLTDFGGLCVNAPATSRTYSVFNSGTSALQINAVRFITASTPFSITASPAIYSANSGGTFAIAISPTTTGSYVNTVVVETNDCSNPQYSFVVSGTVNALPTVSVSASATQVCVNSTVSLSGAGANTYTWTAGVTNGSAFSPTATAVYSVSGTSTLTGCSNTATQSIVVQPLPTITVAGSPTICQGGNASLNGVGGITYTWTGLGSGSTQIVNPTVTTVYTVTGTGTNNCVNVATHTLVVNLIPTITIASGTLCAGQIFTLTPTGAGVGGTYSMTAGTSTISGNNYLVSPATSTFFVIIGTATTGCTSYGTMNGVSQLTVSPLPTLVVNSPSLCTGNSAVISPSGAATYTITGGTFTVSPLTTTAYSITGTSSVGCAAAQPAVSQVTVFTSPVITVNSGSVCNGQSIAIVPSGASTYSITGNNFTVSPTTTTAYSVTGTGTNGCTSALSAVSNVSVFPNPTITVASGSICAGQSFTMSPTGAASYTYSSGSAVVNPSVSTVYSITGTSSVGCVAPIAAQVNLTVNAVPVLTVNSGSICSGSSFVINPTGASTYTVSGNNFTVSPLTTTSYSISGTSTAGCISTVQAVSQVSVLANPTLAVSSGSICQGNSFAIVPTGATSYTITGGNFTVSPTTTTAYSVTGSFSYGCTSTLVVSNVSVYPNPTISATSGSICTGQVFTITPSGANNYTYTSGSNTVSPLTTTSYSVIGSSSVGCVSPTAAVVTITVNAVPALTVNSGTICQGGTFVVTPSGASTYSITGNNFSVTPLTTTSYSISGTSTAGCVSTLQAVSQVSVLLNPTIAVASATLCDGGSYTIVPTGADTYTISGGSFVVTPSVTTSYAVSGSYSYGCNAVNPAVSTITVFALPIITATNGAICINDTYTITPSGASTYTCLPAGPVVNPTTTTNYTITGTSTDGCLSASGATMNVTVNPLPTITVANGTICVGDGFTLTPSGANTYTFNPAGPAVNPTTTSQYSITGTSADGCLSAAATIATVVVNNNPTLTAEASSTNICAGDSVKFTATGASTYTWTGSAVNGTYFIPAASGDYTVTGQDVNGCLGTSTLSLTVRSLPLLTVTASNPASCANETITLSAKGADTFTFNGSAPSVSVAVSPSVTTNYTVIGTATNGCSNSTIYTHTVIPCSGDVEFNAVVSDVSCRLRNDGSITLVPRITFTNTTIQYVWTGAKCPNNDCSTIKNLAAGNYSVRINVTSTVTSTYIRKDSVERSFLILDVQPSCDLKIYNTITLNSNGLNDVWNIDNIDLYPNNKIAIFNRWGAKVYEVNGYNNTTKAWPTVADREFLPAGTYFYVIDLGDNKPIKGWLEIIKE